MKVFEFSDTTSFFKKAYQSSREGNPSLTIERYAKRLGLGTSTLKMILSGKRDPTVHQVLSAARGLRLSPQDTSYLETLCLREGAQNAWEKSYYSKILNQKKKDVRISTINTSKKELLAEPMVLPLLVWFLENRSANIDISSVAKQLSTTTQYIETLIEKFRSDDMLMQQPDGKFHVSFDKLSHRSLQKKYQKNLLANVAQKIELEYDNPESLFISYAFTANSDLLMNFQMDIKSLMDKYMSETPGEAGKVVAQASIQLVPILKM